MKKDIPFIKKFQVDGDFFIYDVNTNKFFKVDEPVYHLIDKNEKQYEEASKSLAKFPLHVINEAIKNIDSARERGYFSSHRPKITYFHSIPKEKFMDFLKTQLNSNLRRIALVVTEFCNHRCRYCSYSGIYAYNRKHSRKHMTSQVMRKAVDFYFSRNHGVEEKNVSFFGGEPLANFRLIRECVNYINETYSDAAQYNMTTNGTLLDREKIRFLADNNFSVLVSIDGPKEVHDRYRVFRNGKGTFDRLMSNLEMMKEMYPDYFNSKVRFNVVLAPPIEFERINEFITRTDIKPAAFKFSYVNDHFTSFYNKFPPEQLAAIKKSKIENLESFNRKLASGEVPNELEKNMFIQRYLHIHRRSMEALPSEIPSNGQCILGERSIFINVDGSFNFCSKIDDSFNLGNPDTGFDYKRIEKIYFDMEKLLSERCYGCWAIRFCGKCINDVNKNGVVDGDVFERLCSSKKISILNEIKDYIKIRESNPQALNYLEGITIS